MKPFSELLQKPEVQQKLEFNATLQLDNPIKSKPAGAVNITKGVRRIRVKPTIKVTKEFLTTLKTSSLEYHKNVSKNDASFLKSDLHGAELEVIKSKCFSLIGLKGIIVQESFSTFKICRSEDSRRLKTIPKASCIFLVRINGNVHIINGDHFKCSSGFRTSKKFKNKPTFYLE